MTYIERMKQHQDGSPAQCAERDRIAAEIAVAGLPTPVEMRAKLRVAMACCPACTPEEADDIADGALVEWLLSHGVEPASFVGDHDAIKDVIAAVTSVDHPALLDSMAQEVIRDLAKR